MEESILSANGLGGLEAGARDAVRTIMEQTGIESLDDVQGALRQGALKVRLSFLFLFSVLRMGERWTEGDRRWLIRFCGWLVE
jgi:hypothetical protein